MLSVHTHKREKYIISHTDQLERGKVSLPPQVFLHMWSERGETVVAIHDHMYETVQSRAEKGYNHTWARISVHDHNKNNNNNIT